MNRCDRTCGKPHLLDAFCCAGAASMGYARAGFCVEGVDIADQPEYPFPFVQDDAITWTRDHADEYDLIAGSPPCHDHSVLSSRSGLDGTGDLLDEFLTVCRDSGKPWIVENVQGAADRMPGALMLCGSEFGLKGEWKGRTWWLARHRLFLASFDLWGAGGCNCWGKPVTGVYGWADDRPGRAKGWKAPTPFAQQLLGTPWITKRDRITQAIPPAYTEFLGEQAMAHLAAVTA